MGALGRRLESHRDRLRLASGQAVARRPHHAEGRAGKDHASAQRLSTGVRDGERLIRCLTHLHRTEGQRRRFHRTRGGKLARAAGADTRAEQTDIDRARLRSRHRRRKTHRDRLRLSPRQAVVRRSHHAVGLAGERDVPAQDLTARVRDREGPIRDLAHQDRAKGQRRRHHLTTGRKFSRSAGSHARAERTGVDRARLRPRRGRGEAYREVVRLPGRQAVGRRFHQAERRAGEGDAPRQRLTAGVRDREGPVRALADDHRAEGEGGRTDFAFPGQLTGASGLDTRAERSGIDRARLWTRLGRLEAYRDVGRLPGRQAVARSSHDTVRRARQRDAPAQGLPAGIGDREGPIR